MGKDWGQHMSSTDSKVKQGKSYFEVLRPRTIPYILGDASQDSLLQKGLCFLVSS